MAGYSTTPLRAKLGIKPGAVVAFRSAPPEFAAALGELPEAVEVKRRAVPRSTCSLRSFPGARSSSEG